MHSAPDVLLLVSPNCPHCGSVLQSLSELVKQAEIGRLEVINISVHPEISTRLDVRSVPWMKIGQFELVGSYTPAELTSWISKSASDTGHADYLSELLARQQLDKALDLVRQEPPMLQAAMELIAATDTPMVTRIGVGAIMEELTDSEALASQVDRLVELTHAEEASIRADACHYLGLSGAKSALPWLKAMLQDQHEHVREIAQDSLERLENLD
jgi:thioredoxin-like negative regulator of GroEL